MEGRRGAGVGDAHEVARRVAGARVVRVEGDRVAGQAAVAHARAARAEGAPARRRVEQQQGHPVGARAGADVGGEADAQGGAGLGGGVDDAAGLGRGRGGQLHRRARDRGRAAVPQPAAVTAGSVSGQLEEGVGTKVAVYVAAVAGAVIVWAAAPPSDHEENVYEVPPPVTWGKWKGDRVARADDHGVGERCRLPVPPPTSR